VRAKVLAICARFPVYGERPRRAPRSRPDGEAAAGGAELRMHCPFCSADDTKVIDSRLVSEGVAGAPSPRVPVLPRALHHLRGRGAAHAPGDQAGRQPGALQRGQAALRLPARAGEAPRVRRTIEAEISNIKQSLRATGEREVNSRVLGELVMDSLKSIDKVAYVRFASVYRSFEDIAEFQVRSSGCRPSPTPVRSDDRQRRLRRRPACSPL
jgi:transcriptional repressor NrdR